jgi:molecular chaperone GrpE
MPLENLDPQALLVRANELQAASDRNYDLYLRSQAEMENMKKRFQREKVEWAKFSNESLVKDLLPVMDNLEKALAHAQEGPSSEGLAEGVALTLKGFKDVLSRAGVEEVKALGAKFDPNLHQAISQQPDESVEDGTVLIEVQKGFLLNGRLIRPSMVVVSKMK